ncbi:MAG: MBL fold metallo-hydrolase [Alphaproteobacteria bacterium]|nr:MBL fold metallo-hydrolase [Alphaproteobacteria bacterium]
MSILFRRKLSFEYGAIASLSPLVRRIVARNPSPFTLYGTGTYIVGRGQVAVIDPGPDLAPHVVALTRALDGETVTHILVTHTHRDHSPAAAALRRMTGAPTAGFGPHRALGPGEDAVEEGADYDFRPDLVLADGALVRGSGWSIEAVHTPGHTANHLCFALREERLLFCGDHVMAWSTTVIAPPDGDMAAYRASLRTLLDRTEVRLWPTHGPAVEEPARHVRALLAHRADREAAILACVARGVGTIPAMVEEIYRDTPRTLHAVAARSVHAHLIELVATGRVTCDGQPALSARYAVGKM